MIYTQSCPKPRLFHIFDGKSYRMEHALMRQTARQPVPGNTGGTAA
ncbi:MAG: hypothetical protein Q4B26_06750 [Eubacteriales bacterium]|nr:hypothetical protein [Eubacteriales bacterium]